jgi:hypothetical protein
MRNLKAYLFALYIYLAVNHTGLLVIDLVERKKIIEKNIIKGIFLNYFYPYR